VDPGGLESPALNGHVHGKKIKLIRELSIAMFDCHMVMYSKTLRKDLFFGGVFCCGKDMFPINKYLSGNLT
jgi:hypothetical protein